VSRGLRAGKVVQASKNLAIVSLRISKVLMAMPVRAGILFTSPGGSDSMEANRIIDSNKSHIMATLGIICTIEYSIEITIIKISEQRCHSISWQSSQGIRSYLSPSSRIPATTNKQRLVPIANHLRKGLYLDFSENFSQRLPV